MGRSSKKEEKKKKRAHRHGEVEGMEHGERRRKSSKTRSSSDPLRKTKTSAKAAKKKKEKKEKKSRSRRDVDISLQPGVSTRRTSKTVPVEGLPDPKLEARHPVPATDVKQHEFLVWRPNEQTDLNTTRTFTFTRRIPKTQMWR
jgi:hypothetical protein